MAGKSKSFPQANSIPLVLKMLSIINTNKDISKNDIALMLGIVPRQVDYYLGVLYFFELISINNDLTLKGRFISDPVIDEVDKLKIFKNIMVEHPVFKYINDYIEDNKEIPKVNLIALYINEYYVFSKSTLFRRASTVKSWFEYFKENRVYGEIPK